MIRLSPAALVAIALLASCAERPMPGGFPARREAATAVPEPVVKVIQGQDPRPPGGHAPAALPDGPPIEVLHLDRVPMDQACQLLTRLLGTNVVASSRAGARTVSLYLRDIPPRAAIEALCRSNGLSYRSDPGIVRLLAADEGGDELVVCRDEETRLYRLRHASATGVADLIAALMPGLVDYQQPADETSFGHVGTDGDSAMDGGTTGGASQRNTSTGSTGTSSSSGARTGGINRSSYNYSLADTQSAFQRGQAQAGTAGGSQASATSPTAVQARSGASPATMSVFLRDNCVAVRSQREPLQREIAGIIAALDSPTRQVLLEVKILRVALGNGFDSLFQFAYLKTDRSPQLAAAMLQNATPAGSAVTFGLLNDRISSAINLLQTDHRLQVAATPLLLCANNAPAEFFSGVQRMITVNYDFETRYTGSGDSSSTVDIARPVVEQRDIGTKVRIKPSINADSTVTMRFLLDTGEVNEGGGTISQIQGTQVVKLPIDTVNSERVESIVVARHGQAVVMGGLIAESVKRHKEGVPWLSDIPWLGTLFSQRSDLSQRTETVVLIVPHIMATAEQGGAVSGESSRRLSTHPWVRHDESALTDWNERSGKLDTLAPPAPATSAAARPATAAEAR